MSTGPRRATFFANSKSTSSAASTTNPHLQAALETKIADKIQEQASLIELRDLSKNLYAQLEKMLAELESLESGTEVVAQIMDHWNSVLRTISLASTSILSREESARQSSQGPSKDDDELQRKAKLPEKLVRMPLTN
ncbi:DASH complex subunit Dad2-domain-containing protein [Lipomyces oligophaga]|uniref:DASH complex subunit Dad2-domain-containing protein n=1 Tax=Lipomyces oligophaga TaxID=45792 RepID=UPI0034CFE557